MTRINTITNTDVIFDGFNAPAGIFTEVWAAQTDAPVTLQFISGLGDGIQSAIFDVYAGNDPDALKRVATVNCTGTELFVSTVAYKFWRVQFISGFSGVRHRAIIGQ